MNIVIIGAAGFIGTNLAIRLSYNNHLLLVDRNPSYFEHIKALNLPNIDYYVDELTYNSEFDRFIKKDDIVYHLFSTSIPTTSNQQISQELETNVIFSSNLFETCGRQCVKQVVFLSSGGTVYGIEGNSPQSEESVTNPITSYGLQKIAIEKLLYLNHYIYGFDYKIIRLANPYGPFQRPNGVLGAVTTFIYRALKDEKIIVYGDGSVVRDFIYIDDAIDGILKISNQQSQYNLYNLGSGKGTSIKELLDLLPKVLGKEVKIEYTPARGVDVPINYLDISRYERQFGVKRFVPLEVGISKTAKFIMQNYL